MCSLAPLPVCETAAPLRLWGRGLVGPAPGVDPAPDLDTPLSARAHWLRRARVADGALNPVPGWRRGLESGSGSGSRPDRARAAGAPPGMAAEARVSRWYFGGLASCGAACCTHPLDLLKVRVARAGAGGGGGAGGCKGPGLRAHPGSTPVGTGPLALPCPEGRSTWLAAPPRRCGTERVRGRPPLGPADPKMKQPRRHGSQPLLAVGGLVPRRSSAL